MKRILLIVNMSWVSKNLCYVEKGRGGKVEVSFQCTSNIESLKHNHVSCAGRWAYTRYRNIACLFCEKDF